MHTERGDEAEDSAETTFLVFQRNVRIGIKVESLVILAVVFCSQER